MRVSSLFSRTSIVRRVVSHLRLAIRLARDPGVPLKTKAILALGALYLLSPLDLLPDVVPLLGQIDDLTVGLITLELFLRSSPTGPISHHRSEIAQGRRYSPSAPSEPFIEAEWRRE